MLSSLLIDHTLNIYTKPPEMAYSTNKDCQFMYENKPLEKKQIDHY